MTRMMMSFFAAISILAFVPSICAAGDDGEKTEKKMENSLALQIFAKEWLEMQLIKNV